MTQNLRNTLIAVVIVLAALLAVGWWLLTPSKARLTVDELSGPKPTLAEEKPETIPSVATAKPIGWSNGELPKAAAGLTVVKFASDLDHPRTMLTLDNGDVLVAETNGPPMRAPADGIMNKIRGMVMGYLFRKVGAGAPSANRITVLRDADGDGVAESRSVLIGGLNSPFGMAVAGGQLYIGNTDGVVSVPFTPGETKIAATPTKLFDLPGGGNHWARNVVATPDGKKLYVTVGSSSNIGEYGMDREQGRAAIFEYDIAAKQLRPFAAGLRNPNGLAFNPDSGELWTTVNERDQLGVDLVPDYLTNVPIGAQYGWPWVYYKNHIDARVEAPMPNFLTEYTRKPEYALGAHVAALGLLFSDSTHKLGGFGKGAFIARHGSWNRSPLTGYDVVFVEFDDRGNALPQKPLLVLNGFLAGKQAHGRPVWLQWAKSGGLLVSDDVGNAIWLVRGPSLTPASAPPVPPTR